MSFLAKDMPEREKDKNKNKARSARLHLSRTLQRITQEHGIYSSKEEELEWRERVPFIVGCSMAGGRSSGSSDLCAGMNLDA